MMTQEDLKRRLKYYPSTGIFKWRVVNCNRVKVGDIAGYKRPDGYIRIRLNWEDYLSHRLAWLYVNGYFPEHDIDHINRNPADNRFENLREVSRSCNIRNAKVSCINKSGVTGVYWFKGRQKHRAQIKVGGKTLHIGIFEDFDEAVAHRLAAEQCLNWSGCNSTSSAYLHSLSWR